MKVNTEDMLHRADSSYPTEYLLSRIRGRRTSLITEWEPLVYSSSPYDYLTSARYRDVRADASPENIWIHLLRELRWVYCQMNHDLRDIFHSFFLYTELRTIYFCLRFKAAHEHLKIAGMLSLSLLSAKCKKALLASEEVPQTIARLEEYFLPLTERFKGISALFKQEGAAAFERHLTDLYLAYAVTLQSHRVVHDFFMRIIDSRNILSIAKQSAWDMRTAPPLISGGTVTAAQLQKIVKKKEGWSISSIILRLTQQAVQETDLTSIEHLLYTYMSRQIRMLEQEPDGIGLILDYLWRCSLEARNLSIVLYGSRLDRGAVMSELVS